MRFIVKSMIQVALDECCITTDQVFSYTWCKTGKCPSSHRQNSSIHLNLIAAMSFEGVLCAQMITDQAIFI